LVTFETHKQKEFFSAKFFMSDAKRILVVIGTRPNFIKVTQLKKQAQTRGIDLRIVHTGQHYDHNMADVFFEQFELVPDYFLHANGSSVIAQMCDMMVKLEQLLHTDFTPHLLVVVGDVNSTFAGALVANKCNIPLAHIESGLRSFDDTMPEEHNRILTDAVTRYFFVTEPSGKENLLKEGKPEENIFMVGNTMIDTLVAFRDKILAAGSMEKLGLQKDKFVLMTMHRPATVDNKEGLQKLMELIRQVTKNYQLVFPIHPRTVKNLEQAGLHEGFSSISGLITTGPLDYFSFQQLVSNAAFVITDSGGIQEETTFLKIPCLTLRENTERPITCSIGSNTLIPFDLQKVKQLLDAINNGTYKKGEIPEGWDGQASARIMDIISSLPL
jgi:UDP-N-acetylglucosamine 2-epimerase (non-hydrolysing)